MKTEIKKSPTHNRGVFAKTKIKKNSLIEICQVIPLSKNDLEHIDKTNLYNYYFRWHKYGAIALGNGSLYNHSYSPNAFYYPDYKNNTIIFESIKDISKNEEIFVNYNGNPNNQKKVWFDK
jgi:SET domain-containing protein